MRIFHLRLGVQGQSAELNLYCVSEIITGGEHLGYYFGDVIRNSKVSNVIQYCINFEERWGGGEQLI